MHSSLFEYRDGQDARSTRIVEKLTIQLDAQQLISILQNYATVAKADKM
jgi:hypothetical protein